MTEAVQNFNLRPNGWVLGIVLWIGVIFFSSTSIAARWCEDAFRVLSGVIFSHLHADDATYGLIHLFADKSVHVGLFLVLGLLLWQAPPNAHWKVARIILFGAAVGSASEFFQSFFPGRDPAVRDVLINVGGTAVGICVCLGWMKYRSRSEALVLK